MENGRRYDQEYKDIIVDLYKSGMSLAELSSEYDIAKSTINGQIKDVKEIKIDNNEVMTLKEVKTFKKEMARIKEENEILNIEPTEMGEVTIAVFDDICGNLIQIVQKQFYVVLDCIKCSIMVKN